MIFIYIDDMSLYLVRFGYIKRFSVDQAIYPSMFLRFGLLLPANKCEKSLETKDEYVVIFRRTNYADTPLNILIVDI